jgi:hypothetical protein
MLAKCPGCKNAIARFNMHELGATTASLGAQRNEKALAFSCPACHVIVSVQQEPIVSENAIMNGILKILNHPKGIRRIS